MSETNQSGGSAIKTLTAAAWERVSDPFAFAFLVAFVAENWKALYLLARMDSAMEAAALAEKHWQWHTAWFGVPVPPAGLWVPLALALGYAFFYGFLRAAIMTMRVWIADLQTRWVRRVHQGRHVVVSQIQQTPEYQSLSDYAENLAQHITTAWLTAWPPGSYSRLLLQIHPVAEPVTTPTFLRVVSPQTGPLAANFDKDPKRGEVAIIYAFANITPQVVVAATVGGFVPWPELTIDADVIALVGTTTVTKPSEAELKQAVALLRRTADRRWGKVEVPSGA